MLDVEKEQKLRELKQNMEMTMLTGNGYKWKWSSGHKRTQEDIDLVKKQNADTLKRLLEAKL